VRLALWTPLRDRGWPARLAPALERSVELVVIGTAATPRPAVDLDLYHLADDPAHGFVYRALLDRPGLVLLDDWTLHHLVWAETAARGEIARFTRDARRERGATGEFIARQVVAGRGGALARLLPLNGRVLDACVALATPHEEIRALAAPRLPGRTVVRLALDDPGAPPERLAAALLALARVGLGRLADRVRALEEAAALEATPLGRALEAVRPRALELGLAELPAGARARIAARLPGAGGRLR
jgi:hypothetical protein